MSLLCRCGHCDGWHFRSGGSCLECSCREFVAIGFEVELCDRCGNAKIHDGDECDWCEAIGVD